MNSAVAAMTSATDHTKVRPSAFHSPSDGTDTLTAHMTITFTIAAYPASNARARRDARSPPDHSF
jgi:hypothetical protein